MKFTLKKIAHISLVLGELFVLPCIGGETKKGKLSSKKTPFVGGLSLPSARVFKDLDKTLSGLLSYYTEHYDFKGGKNKRLNVFLPHKGKTIRLAGASADSLSASGEGLEQWRKIGGDAVAQAKALKISKVVVLLDTLVEKDRERAAQAITEGALLAGYEFSKYKSKKAPADKKEISFLFVAESLKQSEINSQIKTTRSICDAVCLTRDLVNTPPNDLPPQAVLAAARKVASTSSRISLRAYNARALERMGAGALVAVGKGSSADPFLLHLTYKPRQKKGRKQKKIVLIGKGVTFDSGGLSIKPAKGMEDMKCDMAGAAAVLGVMRILGTTKELGAHRHEIHVIIPTTENMINGKAVRPGDIERTLSGKTVEILNTDAEGRLILADALAYAAKVKPDIVIDLATLTGACVVALGNDYAGLFANNSELQTALEKAGKITGERLWPLPLADEYRPSIDSPVADLKNIGDGTAGAIIGALFLREFVPAGAAWAHLDIAGPAFWGKSNEYIARGGTGFGVRTLIRYLESV